MKTFPKANRRQIRNRKRIDFAVNVLIIVSHAGGTVHKRKSSPHFAPSLKSICINLTRLHSRMDWDSLCDSQMQIEKWINDYLWRAKLQSVCPFNFATLEIISCWNSMWQFCVRKFTGKGFVEWFSDSSSSSSPSSSPFTVNNKWK